MVGNTPLRFSLLVMMICSVDKKHFLFENSGNCWLAVAVEHRTLSERDEKLDILIKSNRRKKCNTKLYSCLREAF